NMANLQKHYKEKVAPALQKQLNCNLMAVPRLTKVTLNMGVGETTTDMTVIAGQKPVITKAKKAISNFKVRDGFPVGVKVTLRRERMYEFLERLIAIALPRIRDFRGLPAKGFDGSGNYNFGITEQIIFPEIDFDKVDAIRGMNVTITTSA